MLQFDRAFSECDVFRQQARYLVLQIPYAHRLVRVYPSKFTILSNESALHCEVSASECIQWGLEDPRASIDSAAGGAGSFNRAIGRDVIGLSSDHRDQADETTMYLVHHDNRRVASSTIRVNKRAERNR